MSEAVENLMESQRRALKERPQVGGFPEEYDAVEVPHDRSMP